MSSGEASTSSGATDDTSAATTTGDPFRRDVGWDQDLGSSTPVGCDGKIDFLFVISRASVTKDMSTGQTDLKDTFNCAARVGVSGEGSASARACPAAADYASVA